MKSKPIPFDVLKAFHDAADDVLALSPWEFMEEDENFAIPLPGGETFYASVTGSADISHSIIFYREAKGWATYLKMRSGEADPGEILQEIHSLNLDFEPWSAIPPETRDRLKRIGLGPGQGLLPAPLAYRPGRRPTPPDRDELELLTRLTRIALPFLHAYEDDPGWLRKPPTPGYLFHLNPEADADTVGEWRPQPSAPEPARSAVPPDLFALGGLKERGLRKCSPWEVHVGDMGAVVRDPEGDYFPLSALFADAETGFILDAVVAKAEDMPAQLPQALMMAMEKQGAHPVGLHVNRDDVAAWLESIAGNMRIPIHRKKKLPQAEAAMKALRENMRGFQPGPRV